MGQSGVIVDRGVEVVVVGGHLPVPVVDGGFPDQQAPAPPSGMPPIFFTSTWTRKPGWSCSLRCTMARVTRTTWPVTASQRASGGLWWRSRTRPMVEG